MTGAFPKRFARAPYLIAEIGVNHDGSVDRAKSMMAEAVRAGFDAVKFQYWILDDLLAADVPTAPYQGSGDQRSLLEGLALTTDELVQLRGLAASAGVDFIVTPDGPRALVDVLALQPDALKIGSGDADNPWLLDGAAESGLPLVVSTGMSSHQGDALLVERLGDVEELVLLHCVSAYPTPLREARLGRIPALRELGIGAVGFSDHTLGVAAAAAAIGLGATMIEKHVTWSTAAPGPDHSASLDLADAAAWVADIRDVAEAVTVEHVSMAEEQNREVVRKALHLARDMSAGEVLTADDLVPLRPLLDGIPARDLAAVLGLRLARDIAGGERLMAADLRPASRSS